jgi:hypothetical protein
MKTMGRISVVALLLAGFPSLCFALDVFQVVSRQRAEELGIAVRAKAAGPNTVHVTVEFEAEGELKSFDRATLDLLDGNRLLVSTTMRDERTPSGRVVLTITADRSQLERLTLTAFLEPHLGSVGYKLPLSKFVDLKSVR